MTGNDRERYQREIRERRRYIATHEVVELPGGTLAYPNRANRRRDSRKRWALPVRVRPRYHPFVWTGLFAKEV